MMEDLETLADEVARLREQLAAAKKQVAAARREGMESVIAQFPMIAGHKDEHEEGRMDERDTITDWCRAQLKEMP